MTLTERIVSALKEPNDEEIFQQSREISYSAVAEIQQDMGLDEDNARYSLQNVIYTLLLERKALLAQVEEMKRAVLACSTLPCDSEHQQDDCLESRKTPSSMCGPCLCKHIKRTHYAAI